MYAHQHTAYMDKQTVRLQGCLLITQKTPVLIGSIELTNIAVPRPLHGFTCVLFF